MTKDPSWISSTSLADSGGRLLTKCTTFCTLFSGFLSDPLLDILTSNFWSNCPDWPSFTFQTPFLKNENLYRSYLQSIPVGSYLSVDHTYKIAANVGYLRSDQKWVSQYDGVFIVFNSDGRIVSWQFTKSGSFNEVRPILVALADRSNAQETVVNSVFIDNCCQWRGKLQEVFGTTCKVKARYFTCHTKSS